MRESVQQNLQSLKHKLREIYDLRAAGSMLTWDQSTYMPKGGAEARARQRATLSRVVHQKSTDKELGQVLDALQAAIEELPEDEACLVRVARRDFDRSSKLPSDFIARVSECCSASYAAWARARDENDFAGMAPHLNKTVALSRDYAAHFTPFDHTADPLIDGADQGMTVDMIRGLFSQLRPGLIRLTKAIAERPPIDSSCLRGQFGAEQQLKFSRLVVEKIGYEFNTGRIDKTLHPFCTRLASSDVRITTRVREDDLGEALFSTLHEAGHGLYEQNIAIQFDGTPLGRGTSAGVHESQARLFENVIGRSLEFWRFWYPCLQQTFPTALAGVPMGAFHRAINRVERSVIRTDADEVTYNLHVMMRFDLELDMLEGRLDVKDLPQAWSDRLHEDLGVRPQTHRDGCLQDVHWFSGLVGGRFQGYAIGNVLSAQFFAAARRANPGLSQKLQNGNYAELLAWLRDNVYRHGRKYEPSKLVERATGQPLNVSDYLMYLREKYGQLYNIPLSQL